MDAQGIGDCISQRAAPVRKAKQALEVTYENGVALKQLEGKRSNAPARIESLARAVLGAEVEDVSDLRYQLLHSSAAALISAAEHEAERALLVIHEFRTEKTRERNLERNARDLESFVSALGHTGTIQHGHVIGPFSVPGGGRVPSDVTLHVLKVVRRLDSGGATISPIAPLE